MTTITGGVFSFAPDKRMHLTVDGELNIDINNNMLTKIYPSK
jgi:hypothetical protein